MSKFVRTAGVLGTFAVWTFVAWVGVEGGSVGTGGLESRLTFDAAALVPTLPHVLVPPAVPSGRQLVAMVARDIDADGDLDVVANDGSLHLFVWINDGTGRLTRREASQSSDIRSVPTGPGFANEPGGPGMAVHSVFSFVQPRSSIGSLLAERSRPRSDGSSDILQPGSFAHRTPRAPPAFDSLS